MFALAKSASNELMSLQFGDRIDPREAPIEERIPWILEDYDRRRDELTLLSASQSARLLESGLEQSEGNPAKQVIRIRALGFLRVTSSSRVLEPLLGNSSKEVVLETIFALGRIGALKSLPKLEEFLDSPDADLKRAAIASLSKQLQRSAFQKLDGASEGNADLRAIVRKGKKRLDALEAKNLTGFVMGFLDTDEWEDLWPMMFLFGQQVADIMSDPKKDLIVRQRAIQIIATSRYYRANPQLGQLLRNSRDPHASQLRPYLAVAAGRCWSSDFLEPLAEWLSDADSTLAANIIHSIGEIHSPDGLRPLLSQWGAHGGTLRVAVRLALRRLGRISGAGTLEAALRSGAAWQPAAIYFISGDMQLHRRYTAGLLDGELSGPPEARRDAILLMAFLANGEELEKLETLTKDEDEAIREPAILATGRVR